MIVPGAGGPEQYIRIKDDGDAAAIDNDATASIAFVLNALTSSEDLLLLARMKLSGDMKSLVFNIQKTPKKKNTFDLLSYDPLFVQHERDTFTSYLRPLNLVDYIDYLRVSLNLRIK